MIKQIKTLIIRYNNYIHGTEIPQFRGAIINAVGQEDSLLFHNHDGEKTRYAYPLIQYKRINKKAAIFCIGEGTEEIGKLFASCNFDVQIDERSEHLEVESVKADKTIVQVWDDMFTYRIRKWLPLNQEHYVEYQQLDGVIEKLELLENILVGNILSFGKGIGVTFDKQIVCKITEVLDNKLVTYKGVKMMAFDVEFKSNVSLPDYAGIGKGVSLGMGVVVKKNNRVENNEK